MPIDPDDDDVVSAVFAEGQDTNSIPADKTDPSATNPPVKVWDDHTLAMEVNVLKLSHPGEERLFLEIPKAEIEKRAGKLNALYPWWNYNGVFVVPTGMTGHVEAILDAQHGQKVFGPGEGKMEGR